MKLFRVILSSFLLCIPWIVRAQDEVYRMELGGGVGGSFYLGDANSKPFAHFGPMGGVMARYILNPHMAIKGNLALGHISGNTGKTFFPENAGSEDADGGRQGFARFTRNVIDFGAQFEFNFWGYGIGRGYEGYSRITPYMLIGAGVTIAPKPVETDAGFNIPLGVGMKFKVKRRLNIGLEWSVRFTTTDRLDVSNTDGVILDTPYGVKSSGFKNKDCYSFTMLFVTYDLFPRCVNCNNIKYVF
ncbi:MAG: DUF6089 family protein [Paraprevotella sp.]|nr:DUF6089 family protein [Paraprevotella sp.]